MIRRYIRQTRHELNRVPGFVECEPEHQTPESLPPEEAYQNPFVTPQRDRNPYTRPGVQIDEGNEMSEGPCFRDVYMRADTPPNLTAEMRRMEEAVREVAGIPEGYNWKPFYVWCDVQQRDCESLPLGQIKQGSTLYAAPDVLDQDSDDIKVSFHPGDRTFLFPKNALRKKE